MNYPCLIGNTSCGFLEAGASWFNDATWQRQRPIPFSPQGAQPPQALIRSDPLLISVRKREKTHNVWAFKQFTERFACTAEEHGISVGIRSEAWTSQECPQCGSTDRTTGHQDTLSCEWGFEDHADLTASETLLKRYRNSESSALQNETQRVSSTADKKSSQADGTARVLGNQWFPEY